MWSIDDLADRCLAEPDLDDSGTPTAPLVVVDLGTSPERVDPAVDAVRRISGRTAVVVGVAPSAPELDARLDPLIEALDLTIATDDHGDRRVLVAPAAPTVAAMTLVATTAPRASVALAGLLRMTEALPVDHGLLAESFAYSTLQGGPEFVAWRASRPARPAARTAGDALVRVSRAATELRLTLDHPERRNAFGVQMRDELISGLRIADADPAIERVVIRGTGPAFCSGGDLDQFGTSPDPATAHLVRSAHSAASLLDRLAARIEVVVEVQGACIGAGVELPAFATRVIAAPDASFLLPEVTMGLVPGAGGTVSITHRIGRWRTLALALTAEPVDAQTALAWGLVDAVAER